MHNWQSTTQQKGTQHAFLAFQSLVQPRRASCREVKNIERVEDEPHCLAIITDYLSRIESEIVSICEDVHHLLDSYLIPSEDSAEARVFHWQMKADYFRYLAEIKTDERKLIQAYKAHVNYEGAMRIVKVELRPVNPTRLVAALNFAVFKADILNSTEDAYALAVESFEEGLEGWDEHEHDLDERGSIMYSISDNIELWTSD
ncbi:hypothetical protein AMTRI_Chr04g246560 [Amborella trichopoda]